MALMDNVSSGKQPRPLFLIAYGPDGVGKTTFAASFPKPFFLGAEKGTTHMNVTRADSVNSYEKFMQKLDEFEKEDHDFQTLVVDSLDWLEPMVWDYVCRTNQWKSIEEPGYGKGFTMALEQWTPMMRTLERIVDNKKRNVVLLGHALVKTNNPPGTLVAWDRYQLKLHDKAAAKWRELVDAVLFINYEVFVRKEKAKDTKGKAIPVDEQTRIMFTERMPAHDAKNRLGLPKELPLEYPNGYDGLVRILSTVKAEPTLEELKAEVETLYPQIKDEAVKAKIHKSLEELGTTPPIAKLKGYVDRMKQILETQTL